MPFTFAHPAYAFPLRYINPKYFSCTGLVLGSMAPDFEYFFHLEPHSRLGHSLSGLWLQAIPLSVLLAVTFHYIVKQPLALHLPSLFGLDRRAFHTWGAWRLSSFGDWILFILSVVIGFGTHVTIDAATHAGGFFVDRLSFLEQTAIFHLPIYKILQYGSSAIGLLAVAGAIVYGLYRSNPGAEGMPRATTRRKVLFWTVAVVVSGFTVGGKLIVTDSSNTLGILVVAPISGFCIGIVLSSLIMKMLVTSTSNGNRSHGRLP